MTSLRVSADSDLAHVWPVRAQAWRAKRSTSLFLKRLRLRQIDTWK